MTPRRTNGTRPPGPKLSSQPDSNAEQTAPTQRATAEWIGGGGGGGGGGGKGGKGERMAASAEADNLTPSCQVAMGSVSR